MVDVRYRSASEILQDLNRIAAHVSIEASESILEDRLQSRHGLS